MFTRAILLGAFLDSDRTGVDRGRTIDAPAALVDATPPNTRPGGMLRDVNLFREPHELPAQPHMEPDSDSLPAAPLHMACDWSDLQFTDAQSSVTGFWWGVSSDGGTSSDIIPWMDAGQATQNRFVLQEEKDVHGWSLQRCCGSRPIS